MSAEDMPKPTPITYSLQTIPAYLRERGQWVNWDYELSEKGKWTKVPYQSGTERKAATTRPDEWSTFLQAAAGLEQHDGFGYCLADGEQVVGTDIDHAMTESGPDAVAQDIVDTMQSYTELSVSGTGVHIFAFGTKPGDRCKRGQVEMYGQERFFTVTGRKFASKPATIEARPEQIAAVYHKYLAEPEPAPRPAPDSPPRPETAHEGHTDAEVLEKAHGPWKSGDRFRALYDAGDPGAYGSQSEGDLALCGMLAFWAGPHPEQIDRLFRTSALMRKKWDSKRGPSTYGADTIRKALAGRAEFYAWPSATGEEAWPALQALPDTLPPAPTLTKAMLPPDLADWVFDIAHRMRCPPDYPAVAALIALGMLVGRKVTIWPKQSDTWTVVPNVWGFLEGPPGALKSPAVGEVFAPIYKLAEQAYADHAQDMVGYDAALTVWEIQRDHLKDVIKKAVKAGSPVEGLQKALAALVRPAKPVKRRYLTNDSTIEKLGLMLSENPNGLMVDRDELPGLFAQMEMKGHEQARSFYLEAWDGRRGKAVDRVGRGELLVPHCVLSIIGTVQPGPLARYLDAFYAEGGTDGFIERFQLAVFPELLLDDDFVDEAPDMGAEARGHAIYDRALALVGPQVVRFDAEAAKLSRTWSVGLRHLLRSPDLHPVLQSHLSKYRSLMPSLALLFQVALGKSVGVIGPTATSMAIEWGTFLLAHARRVFWPVIQEEALALHRLARRLPRMVGEEFTARDLVQHEWSGLKDKEVVADALQELERLGWVRGRVVTFGGHGSRRTTKWMVNPAVGSMSRSEGESPLTAVSVKGMGYEGFGRKVDPPPPPPTNSHDLSSPGTTIAVNGDLEGAPAWLQRVCQHCQKTKVLKPSELKRWTGSTFTCSFCEDAHKAARKAHRP